MKRTPLRRNSQLKRTPFKAKKSRLNPVSKKRRKEMTKYSEERGFFLSENPRCQIGVKGCTGQATDVHHVAGRGKNYLDVSTWKASCRNCHEWVHNNGREAREMGFLK